jgi:hypothetical protein
VSGAPLPLRDPETGRRILDAREHFVAAQAAIREAGRGPGFDSVGAAAYRAAGEEPRQRAEDAGVNPPQAGSLILDFTRRTDDGRLVDDHNAIAEYLHRLKVEAAVMTMGPDSGICMQRGDGWVGDPKIVRRAQENDRQRATMQAEAIHMTARRLGPFAGTVA